MGPGIRERPRVEDGAVGWEVRKGLVGGLESGLGAGEVVMPLTSQSTSWLSEQHGTKIRKALEHGVASLSLHDDGKATLQLQEEAWCCTLELSKLPVTEAKIQLQELMFSLVGCVKNLEKRLEVGGTLGSSCSPEKNAARSQQLFMPDPRSRKPRGAGSTLPAKRRIPGESLINPGFKTKKTPGGVDFEDS
ncbi:PREDICTED: uncharacterized protein C9orf142 homolog [Tinamus guttatus]|uniref:uncharacterized protein C9orf142 homolog n=1 Tax=Tinamus guttatus TaxID=94827 RepID=UPI00052F042C|nr:PREDICTED: uncharacterized protein C9orf142 homolog [Tinamus guttatus]